MNSLISINCEEEQPTVSGVELVETTNTPQAVRSGHRPSSPTANEPRGLTTCESSIMSNDLGGEKKTFTLYSANTTGNFDNCLYPNAVEITDANTLRAVTSRDYVCAAFQNNYRSEINFQKADCIGVDCDNEHSDNPDEWVCPADVRSAFPDVTLAVHYSRHHLKPKNGKSARPKFHCVLLTNEHTDPKEHKRLKKLVNSIFPFFDTMALDAARFFFGTDDPKVEFYPGTKTLTEAVKNYLLDFLDDETAGEPGRRVIPEGSRNATLSRFAGRILKRYGDCKTAKDAFKEEAAKCDPPLDDGELNTIWKSALAFYGKVQNQEGYISPAEYNAGDFIYKPDDCTDVGQARALGKYFSGELRYSPATDYIRYTGVYWQETKPGAQAVAHALTDLQLEEALQAIQDRSLAYESTGAADILAKHTKKKAITLLNEEQHAAYDRYTEAVSYMAFALQRRESKYITATLHEARPVLEIDPSILDKDWFLLCTPDATYDLRKGIKGARAHSPEDYITKVTTASPSSRGEDIWMTALDLFFCGDKHLIEYVQLIGGVIIVGQVFLEAMIIAYGDGSNGKSTFWNTIARVLGSYSGHISADALTIGCRRNVKPELAEAKGKRLLIAAELEEGTRLNTSTIKQLGSTDEVFAEKKYKDPFSFIPSHTLVLYTNHLPKVGGRDTGIWRRLIVIPFNAKIEGSSDIKNYGDYLYQNAGEAIMAWLIEGAKKAIDLGFKLPLPKCVQEAIGAYRQSSDWFDHFLTDACDISDGLWEKSGELYTAYRKYCVETNEYTRSTTDFYAALQNGGFMREKTRTGYIVKGLKLVPREFSEAQNDFPDFLE